MATARSTGSPMSSAELVRLNWSSSSINGNGADRFLHTSNFTRSSVSCPRVAQPRAMGNKNEGKGIFAPLVVVTRNVMGKKEFNQLRGKAIALHSQVIGEFCKTIGADSKQKQGLIRLAKKNGEKLGFLA
ncbi:protein PROTON GRADIENT REGULATION 5, chloroplastic [Physcomitrium patens]|uniref:Proton gradient regulation 5 n=1 Tax=Physcomitrium patens TaxID=3218 RepID=A0A2K1K7P0_PHYPA|nr:protein PROTON GRADIENT REGULATION 5, chloroplastic-like [Physcomitrium patens]PNR49786.1 hypothetical protein PHYPA_011682 [Physcomitrium patens]|eukprot:XP_024381828.1 protein PROTON GRADIENT REGULATION 5, chloroplastic-like [Physcomitrella patens]